MGTNIESVGKGEARWSRDGLNEKNGGKKNHVDIWGK